MKKYIRATLSSLTIAASITQSVFAQDVQPISEYLGKVNYAYVSFDGQIKYDSHEDQFIVQIGDGWFHAVSDAGREAREKLQKECGGGEMFDAKWCEISGEGTVEIRGADIWISIEKVNALN